MQFYGNGIIGEVDVTEQSITLFVLCWSEIYQRFQTAGEVCKAQRIFKLILALQEQVVEEDLDLRNVILLLFSLLVIDYC